jgi:bisanhydrobacterioruberin hydratase
MLKKIIDYFKNLTPREVTKFLIIYYFVGITGFLVPVSRPLFQQLIPISLFISLFLVFLFHNPWNKTAILVFLSVFVISFGVEAIGVRTGLLFGEYFYGNALGLKVFDTPLLIGLNWLMLAYGAIAIARSVKFMQKWVAFFAPVFMVAYDFVMEPVAMKTGMWGWAFNSIPWQNYVMWFILSVVVVSLFELFSVDTTKPVAIRIFIAQFVFFAALNLFLP